MSVLNFPASLNIGQLYEFNDPTYRFDGNEVDHRTNPHRDKRILLGTPKNNSSIQEGKLISSDEWELSSKTQSNVSEHTDIDKSSYFAD